jgi:hypothetical protein
MGVLESPSYQGVYVDHLLTQISLYQDLFEQFVTDKSVHALLQNKYGEIKKIFGFLQFKDAEQNEFERNYCLLMKQFGDKKVENIGVKDLFIFDSEFIRMGADPTFSNHIQKFGLI